MVLPIYLFSQEENGIKINIDESVYAFCGTWKSPASTLLLTFNCNSDSLVISNYDTLEWNSIFCQS